jgi:hypothetical protein
VRSKTCRKLPKTGKFLHIGGPPRAQRLSYEGALSKALWQELKINHNTAKILMRWTGARERTVRNWLSGVRGPSAIHLVSLMGNSDEVFRTVLMLAKRLPDPQSNELGAARMHASELLKYFDGGIARFGGRENPQSANTNLDKTARSDRAIEA